MEIVTLTRDLAVELCDQLVALDEAAVREFGSQFATVPWSAQSFCLDRPGKWVLSSAALEEGVLGALLIMSQPQTDTAHCHRMVVHPSVRGQGVGYRLMAHSLAAAVASGLRYATLAVAAGNEGAQAFYLRSGFALLTGQALADYAAAHGLEVDGDVMLDGDHRLRAMVRSL